MKKNEFYKVYNFENTGRRIFSYFLFLFFSNLVFSQGDFQLDSLLIKYKLKQYSVGETSILVYKKNDLPKPTIIFITGSGFNPLFVNGDLIYYPFDIYDYGDQYNFVTLSKPSIPINSDSISNKYINETYINSYYLDNDGKVPSGFTKNNNCTFYTNQYLQIMKFLNHQKWVKKDNIIVIGHSQGALIAASIGNKASSISRLVLMSPGSIYNRFYESTRQIRMNESDRLIKPNNAQAKIDSIDTRYKELLENKNDNQKLFDGSTYYSYYSFTSPTLKDKILKLDQKTLVVYGTASAQDLDCDYLKIELYNKNKSNVEVMALPGYDHNYFENIYNDKGVIIDKKFHLGGCNG